MYKPPSMAAANHHAISRRTSSAGPAVVRGIRLSAHKRPDDPPNAAGMVETRRSLSEKGRVRLLRN